MNDDFIYNESFGFGKIDRMKEMPFVCLGPIKIEPLKQPLGKIYHVPFRYKKDRPKDG